MRFAHFGGAPGLLTSSLAWLVAGIVALRSSHMHAVWTLFVGGMFIYPAAVLLAKVLGRPGTHQPGNPLAALAMEGTVILLFGIALAYAIALAHPEWFFPAMLLVIGGRYLTFSTIYGLRLYWMCGAALAIAAVALVWLHSAMPVGAFAGAGTETVFAAWIFFTVRPEHKS